MPESEEEEALRRVHEIVKDPDKLKEYVASRLDRAVKNWPRR
jgi:hypothetical protein